MKRLLLEEDYDGILGIAREQVESGAHALDVQVALTERTDEAQQMRTLVKKLQMSVELPLVCDTTALREIALTPSTKSTNSTHSTPSTNSTKSTHSTNSANSTPSTHSTHSANSTNSTPSTL